MINRLNKQSRKLLFRRSLGTRTPPSHFSDPNLIPPTYNEPKTSTPPNNITNTRDSVQPTSSSTANPIIPSSSSSSSSSKERNEGPIREISVLLAMCTLAYLAIDSYANRIRLEKLNNETTAINLKTLQIQQTNFLNARKKRDLQILQERKDNDKRTFKMGLHIALLRKQLNDSGVEPIDIDVAIKEFEKNVKADNSIRNVSGQALWLDDKSPLKSYLPDAHDYDKKKVGDNSKE